jgi:hypothetical protein
MTFKAKIGAPPRLPVFYAVTFESATLPPVTLTGQVLASNPARSAYLAVRDARSRAKGLRWSSLVVVLDKQGSIGPPQPSAKI